ncbi:protein of unknown function [Thalassobacillus cyri]|uniref:IrrE N-terminal-like domain-containing protein n=1 Tax=Thalassobacillus cyri TaxID=571932 RepID=A0A1H4BX20_9BACI|nr:ImmA/IrrE family metallo-endopeptidase [Thalassobacillus cyri]SEA52623.1 protein of unknown function [Thalassobacillus cyri]
MKFPLYPTTYLEDWVSEWYIRNGWTNPKDLKATRIARKYRIHLIRKDMPSRYDRFGNYRAIIIDGRCSKEEQREQFYHELCHAIRHTGRQSMMPQAFRELQERDARHFTLYAALPHHMIKEYDLSDKDIISRWANDFRVTEKLCNERYEQIWRRLHTTFITEKY